MFCTMSSYILICKQTRNELEAKQLTLVQVCELHVCMKKYVQAKQNCVLEYSYQMFLSNTNVYY